MHTHSARLLTYITHMSQIDDSIDTKRIFGNFDITDIICTILFVIYTVMALNFTFQAFRLAQEKYLKASSKKSYNLYNLIFMETEFESMQEDLTVSRF